MVAEWCVVTNVVYIIERRYYIYKNKNSRKKKNEIKLKKDCLVIHQTLCVVWFVFVEIMVCI